MAKKIWLFGILVLLLLGAAVFRLFWIAMAWGEELGDMAESQRTRTFDFYQYARGDFLDTKGRHITGVTENCLIVFPSMISDEEAILSFLAATLGYSEDVVSEHMRSENAQSYAPYVLKSGLTAEQANAVNGSNLPGILSVPLSARYEAPYSMADLLGELLSSDDGRRCGASGLELQYDAFLQNRKDTQVVAYFDAAGRLSADSLYLEPLQESCVNMVRLTIDLDHQQIARDALAGLSGACVIIDPENGDISAAVSTPGYDPYGWETLPSDDAYVNKVFASYPPASTFKIVLTAAALETGLGPTPEAGESVSDDLFFCDGSYTIADNYEVSCWEKDGHGIIDLDSALANSCNCYYVGLGLALGGDLIRDYAGRFGLNEQRVIGYSFADNRHIDFSSYIKGDIANVSIGENGIRISPLQSAVMTAVCANGGRLVTPRLVEAVVDQDGKVLIDFPPARTRQTILPETAAQLADMLAYTVSNGTGGNAAGSYAVTAGKTGTSEDAGVWFCGFAPADEPRWAISVYIADGTAGGMEAAQVFKEIVDRLSLLEGIN